MADVTYRASKSRVQGRQGWTISFRHPLRNDSRGKPGLKMRRGLGTADDNEADALVAQMNGLLSDSAWWNANKRQEAERAFDKVIVDSFYDDIQAGRIDGWQLREQSIHLPSRDDGYSRTLLVGTTGAGKTSLLRHMIGSDPERDRFPSTSTAKTTVSDIEVVLKDGPYSAVVTFFSEFLVQANVEECLADACAAIWEGAPEAKVAERLLNHRDQRFRLSYTLGAWRETTKPVEEDEWSFGGGSESNQPDDAEDGILESERAENANALRAYLGRISALTTRISKLISTDLGEDVSRLTGADRDAAQELFEERLQADDAFTEIAQDILDDVRRRFDFLVAGELISHRSGWPELWRFESNSRDEFIEQIRWFSSNYAPQFGRLLTPLVDGIRVSGPLFPEFTEIQPKLVLLDGQGLGHTPDSSASVTTQITRRFEDVDVILVVDNAQQPMQAAPLSVIRAIASSGHQDKLGIAFTHFDHVKGVNLPTFADKKDHVMASVANGLSNLRDVLGAPVVRAIERTLSNQCFMLGALDQPSKNLPQGVIKELLRMFSFFETSIEPPALPETHPVYDTDGLLLAVQAAARGFQRPWAARLGLAHHETTHKEHWTRIKALNRRIAGETGVEFDSLRPVADLLARLTEEISKFLDHPTSWEPRNPIDDEEAESAINNIRQKVYSGLHSLSAHRVVDEHLARWRAAYDYRGKGSTFDRAQEIKGIYEESAPIPNSVITTISAEFMRDIRKLVHEAILLVGGKIQVAQVD